MKEWTEFFKFIGAILASLGGGAVILLAFSSWLGKVWAARLMARERARHEKDLENLRNDLQIKQNERLETLRNELSIFKETHLKEHSEKMAIYRAVIDIVATILAELESVTLGRKERISSGLVQSFEIERLKAYGYLGMLAPQEVMDAQDALMDHLLGIIYDGKTSNWVSIRDRSLNFLNAVRNDVGINKSQIEYRGER